MEKYYTPEQMAQFEELRAGDAGVAGGDRGRRARVGCRSSRRCERRCGLDPVSAKAKALAARWDALQERTMAHFSRKPGLMEAIGRNYAAGSFENIDGAPQAEDLAFIKRVREG